MLCTAVKKIDMVKPARRFIDKEEWKSVLMALQQAGKLTYKMESDMIILYSTEVEAGAEGGGAEGSSGQFLSCRACQFNPQGV